MVMLEKAISILSEGKDLSQEIAAEAMKTLMRGEGTPAQIGAFLMGLRLKGETIEEITGFAQTMRDMATPISSNRKPLVDVVGTGGDHSGTFNISTTAAFVVAGAGIAVAKHGNRSATSKCGSADVLEELGVNLNATPERVGQCIDDVGIGFLFARALHGAMRHVAAPRSELKIRTVFNILGPLTNPARATGLAMGVFSADLTEPLANVLVNLGVERAFVACGSDGLDEITLTGPSKVAEARDGEVKVYEVTPEQFGLERAPKESLLGGDAAENAALLRGVLQGEKGPRRGVVLLNAATGIMAGDGAADWQEGIHAAEESIDSGAALAMVEALAKASNDT
jgi:anthranilate phosphoribosyltransferase